MFTQAQKSKEGKAKYFSSIQLQNEGIFLKLVFHATAPLINVIITSSNGVVLKLLVKS